MDLAGSRNRRDASGGGSRALRSGGTTLPAFCGPFGAASGSVPSITSRREEEKMTKLFRFGGYFASTVLILFGIGSIVLGTLGFLEVRDTIARESITATPDAAEIGVNLEPGQEIRTGGEAKEFAEIIRTHALEITGDRPHAELGRYLTETGEETDDEAEAATDESGRPVENPVRNVWITATAFTTALNTAYLAEQIALFAIVMGVALLLTGIGFLVLAMSALRAPETETV
jgi:hypothetical protein